MYKHFKQLPLHEIQLRKCGTKEVEHYIGVNQGKTSKFNSTNDKPSFADILRNSGRTGFLVDAHSELSACGIDFTSNRRKTRLQHMRAQNFIPSYQWPSSYSKLVAELTEAHMNGLEEGLNLFTKLNPKGHSC